MSSETGRNELRLLRCRNDLPHGSVSPAQRNAFDEHQRELMARNLSQAVRIVPGLFPALATVLANVEERLSLMGRLDAYVHNCPETQAVGFGTADGRMTLSLTSGLVRLLSPSELGFVLGHEVGHCIMDHCLPPDMGEETSDVEELNLMALQRASEISADRVGFVACSSTTDAFRAMIKIASGLPDELIRCDIATYLDQMRELRTLGGSQDELYSTHPMIPVRLRALLWLEMSEVFQPWASSRRAAAVSRDELEERVDKELAAAEGFRLKGINEESLTLALLWGGMALFVADNRLSQAEQAYLCRALGRDLVEKAITFVRQQGPSGVMSKFATALKRVRLVGVDAREALYRDLELLAEHADGARGNIVRILEQARSTLFAARNGASSAPAPHGKTG